MLNSVIESVDIPSAIKGSLQELAKQIAFDKSSPKGANGHIFFGHNSITNQRVAVKYYYWGGDMNYHAEPRQLAKIDSPNVIRILHAEVLNSDWAFFVTPCCQNGDLDDLIAKGVKGNLQSIDIASQILNGLSHLHGQRYVHRDLKPQNILINDNCQAVWVVICRIKKQLGYGLKKDFGTILS